MMTTIYICRNTSENITREKTPEPFFVQVLNTCTHCVPIFSKLAIFYKWFGNMIKCNFVPDYDVHNIHNMHLSFPLLSS